MTILPDFIEILSYLARKIRAQYISRLLWLAYLPGRAGPLTGRCADPTCGVTDGDICMLRLCHSRESVNPEPGHTLDSRSVDPAKGGAPDGLEISGTTVQHTGCQVPLGNRIRCWEQAPDLRSGRSRVPPPGGVRPR
jgi:hypothetical protein